MKQLRYKEFTLACVLFVALADIAHAENEARQFTEQGASFLKQGNFASAEDAYTKSLQLSRKEGNDSHIASALYNLAITYTHTKKYTQAQNLLLELTNMKNRPASVGGDSLSKLQSLIYYGEARYSDAEAVDKALLVSTHDKKTAISARFHLSLTQYCQMKFAESETNLTEVISESKLLPPVDGDEFLYAAYQQRGKLYSFTSRFAKAQADYECELEVLKRSGAPKPLIANAANDVGGVLRAQKHYEKALAAFNQAYDLSPKSQIDYYFYLGNTGCVYLDLGNLEKAESSFNQALKLCSQYCPSDENMAQNISNLASVYAKQGKKVLARQKFNEAIALAEKSKDQSVISMIKKAKQMYQQ